MADTATARYTVRQGTVWADGKGYGPGEALDLDLCEGEALVEAGVLAPVAANKPPTQRKPQEKRP